MPKPKKYWGVERNANRHGRLRWYFRRPDRKGAPRIRLPDSYGSLAFEAAWRAAMAGQPLPLGPGRARARQSRGTLGWLVRLYLTSAEFQAFRPATRKQRVAMLERLAAEKGAVDLEDIGKGAIQDSLNARRATPPMANVWLGTVSNLFAWATRECLPDPLTGASVPILAENPCEGIKRLAIPRSADPDEESGHPTFSDEDLARFEAAYAEGTRERLAYSVLLYTGLRIGDAARLGRQHVLKDGSIKIKTEKTGADVTIGIVPPLARDLAAGPHGRPEVLNFLTGARGLAMDKSTLGHWFGAACQAIGLDRSAHGLRKASARLYAERGASVAQLMALFGWRTPAIAMRYVAMADRKRMALDAQAAMDWTRSRTGNSPTPGLGGGTGGKSHTGSRS
jgi:integrase